MQTENSEYCSSIFILIEADTRGMFKVSALSSLLHRNWGVLLIWSTTDSSATHTEYLQVIMALKILGSFVKILIIPCFNKIQGNKQKIPSYISSF